MFFRTDIKVGCCGFACTPEAYFKALRAVEIQQTFYRLPRPETVARWREKAPEGSVFSLKAWQIITHDPSCPSFRFLDKDYLSRALARCGGFRATDEVLEAWQALRGLADVLNARSVLFQSPPSFDPSAQHVLRMEEFFRVIDRGRLQLAWAPPENWPHKLVAEVCRTNRLIHCGDPLTGPILSRGPVYYRLQGGEKGYRHRYDDKELKRLRRICRRKKGVVFFNTIHMQEDARRFAALLQDGQVSE
jgi:uncharacterized protein YecE (DUF72 family)